MRASLPSPQPVGTAVVWSGRYSGRAGRRFRWSVAAGGGPARVVRDFGPFSSFTYTPLEEGEYTVTLSVRDASANDLGSESRAFTAASLLNAGRVKVTATAHPLVALYSTRCATGQVRVRFAAAGTDLAAGMATPFRPCQGARSINIAVAGMRASTAYLLREEVDTGTALALGTALNFQTGALPVALPVPTPMLRGMAGSPEPVMLALFVNAFGAQPQCPIAYDTAGNVIWYYLDPDLGVDFGFRAIAGGTLIGTTDYAGKILREVDLMGNLVRETNAQRMNRQMQARGYPPISLFSHDAIRLPNGDTAVLATIEKMADQGNGPVNVLGDAVLVLDADWQLKWVWNSFAALDVKRLPRGEAMSGQANDWTHGNSLWRTPADGNFVVSLRNQDWVVKVDYRDGAGAGTVIWRLGPEGDFQAISNDPSPWFTHQHDATLLSDGRLLIYDNGNTRIAANGGVGSSRGQVWRLDEKGKTATLLVNAALSGYSAALGSAELLANGNLSFTSGFLSNGGASEIVEVDGSGMEVFRLGFYTAAYRAFRLFDLYTPPAY